jgi:hypothetical protein
MKFKFKVLATALALAAALPAHATMSNSATGNSSMVLTVLDTVANVSASFDLGKNFLDFNTNSIVGAVSTINSAGTSFTWDLSTNSNYSSAWTSFLNASTSANRKYAITGADLNSGYISTYVSAGVDTVGVDIATTAGNFDTYIQDQNVKGTHVSAPDGSAYQLTATKFYGSGKNNGTGPVVAGAFDTGLGLVQTYYDSNDSFALATNTVFSNANGVSKFTLLSNGSLTYAAAVAAVPEADTSAMMLAGLGLMGFIARRRNRKQA